MDIMIKPIVTEKATKLSEKLSCYTFRVSPDANKYQIKDLRMFSENDKRFLEEFTAAN